MQKVIAATLVAATALAATAALADSSKPGTAAQPSALERIWSGLTGTGTTTATATKSAELTPADRVRLNGYAPTGKPELDRWVRDLRRLRSGGPNG